MALAGVAALLVVPVAATPASAGRPSGVRGAASIAEWNAIAVSTLAADTTKVVQETVLYTAFVQAAVYDAVVGVHGRYEPYRFHRRAPRGTSGEAAAIAAAHRILVTYVPLAQTNLDAAYATTLARIPDGRAKSNGIAFGTAVADNLVTLRTGDGRYAPVSFTTPPAPGVWRPTPPAFASMTAPWLGGVTPLLLRDVTQARLAPPPPLTSARYARDVDEVKLVGAKTSAQRTPEQTSTAIFFSGNAAVQLNAALRDQVSLRGLDLVDAARMFAAADLSAVDGLIAVWRAKLGYGLWRPITAITLADTDPDPAWQPLIATPPYPEYPSGYNVLVAATTRALQRALGTRQLDLTVTSTAVPEVRHYETGAALREDVVNARVWLGIHFRFGDTAARDLGMNIADWALDHYFEPH